MSSRMLLSSYRRLLGENRDQHRRMASYERRHQFQGHANLILLVGRDVCLLHSKTRAFAAAVRVERRKKVLIVIAEE